MRLLKKRARRPRATVSNGAQLSPAIAMAMPSEPSSATRWTTAMNARPTHAARRTTAVSSAFSDFMSDSDGSEHSSDDEDEEDDGRAIHRMQQQADDETYLGVIYTNESPNGSRAEQAPLVRDVPKAAVHPPMQSQQQSSLRVSTLHMPDQLADREMSSLARSPPRISQRGSQRVSVRSVASVKSARSEMAPPAVKTSTASVSSSIFPTPPRVSAISASSYESDASIDLSFREQTSFGSPRRREDNDTAQDEDEDDDDEDENDWASDDSSALSSCSHSTHSSGAYSGASSSTIDDSFGRGQYGVDEEASRAAGESQQQAQPEPEKREQEHSQEQVLSVQVQHAAEQPLISSVSDAIESSTPDQHTGIADETKTLLFGQTKVCDVFAPRHSSLRTTVDSSLGIGPLGVSSSRQEMLGQSQLPPTPGHHASGFTMGASMRVESEAPSGCSTQEPSRRSQPRGLPSSPSADPTVNNQVDAIPSLIPKPILKAPMLAVDAISLPSSEGANSEPFLPIPSPILNAPMLDLHLDQVASPHINTAIDVCSPETGCGWVFEYQVDSPNQTSPAVSSAGKSSTSSSRRDVAAAFSAQETDADYSEEDPSFLYEVAERTGDRHSLLRLPSDDSIDDPFFVASPRGSSCSNDTALIEPPTSPGPLSFTAIATPRAQSPPRQCIPDAELGSGTHTSRSASRKRPSQIVPGSSSSHPKRLSGLPQRLSLSSLHSDHGERPGTMPNSSGHTSSVRDDSLSRDGSLKMTMEDLRIHDLSPMHEMSFHPSSSSLLSSSLDRDSRESDDQLDFTGVFTGIEPQEFTHEINLEMECKPTSSIEEEVVVELPEVTRTRRAPSMAQRISERKVEAFFRNPSRQRRNTAAGFADDFRMDFADLDRARASKRRRGTWSANPFAIETNSERSSMSVSAIGMVDLKHLSFDRPIDDLTRAPHHMVEAALLQQMAEQRATSRAESLASIRITERVPLSESLLDDVFIVQPRVPPPSAPASGLGDMPANQQRRRSRLASTGRMQPTAAVLGASEITRPSEQCDSTSSSLLSMDTQRALDAMKRKLRGRPNASTSFTPLVSAYAASSATRPSEKRSSDASSSLFSINSHDTLDSKPSAQPMRPLVSMDSGDSISMRSSEQCPPSIATNFVSVSSQCTLDDSKPPARPPHAKRMPNGRPPMPLSSRLLVPPYGGASVSTRASEKFPSPRANFISVDSQMTLDGKPSVGFAASIANRLAPRTSLAASVTNRLSRISAGIRTRMQRSRDHLRGGHITSPGSTCAAPPMLPRGFDDQHFYSRLGNLDCDDDEMPQMKPQAPDHEHRRRKRAWWMLGAIFVGIALGLALMQCKSLAPSSSQSVLGDISVAELPIAMRCLLLPARIFARVWNGVAMAMLGCQVFNGLAEMTMTRKATALAKLSTIAVFLLTSAIVTMEGMSIAMIADKVGLLSTTSGQAAARQATDLRDRIGLTSLTDGTAALMCDADIAKAAFLQVSINGTTFQCSNRSISVSDGALDLTTAAVFTLHDISSTFASTTLPVDRDDGVHQDRMSAQAMNVGELRDQWADAVAPSNWIGALAASNVVATVVLAVIAGFVCGKRAFLRWSTPPAAISVTPAESQVGTPPPVVTIVVELQFVLERLAFMVEGWAPLGAISMLSAMLVLHTNEWSLGARPFGWIVIAVLAGALLHLAVISPLVLRLWTGRRAFATVQSFFPALLFSFWTGDAVLALPVVAECWATAFLVTKRMSQVGMGLAVALQRNGHAMFYPIALLFLFHQQASHDDIQPADFAWLGGITMLGCFLPQLDRHPRLLQSCGDLSFVTTSWRLWMLATGRSADLLVLPRGLESLALAQVLLNPVLAVLHTNDHIAVTRMLAESTDEQCIQSSEIPGESSVAVL